MIMIATIIKIGNTIDNRPHLYWVRCLCCFLAVPGYFGWTIGVAAIVFMMVVVMMELMMVVVVVVMMVITLHCSPSALGGWWGCSSKVAAHCLGFGWSGSRAFSLSTIKCHFHYYYHHYYHFSWSDHRYHHFHLNIQRFNNYFHFPHLNVPQSHISNIGAVEQVWV